MRHLGYDGLAQIDPEIVSQFEEVNGHVRQFFAQALALGGSDFLYLFAVLPEEDLLQFGSLDGKGCRHILVVVKLHPVALVPELADKLLELLDRGGHG